MILREILDTSIVILFFKYFYRWYGKIKQRPIDIYCHSQTCKLVKPFWEKVKICSKFSFLGRITEIKQASLRVLDSSRAVRYLIRFYKRWRNKVIHYSKSSSTINLTEDTKNEFILSPAKIIGIVIVTAILANVVLAIILQKQISLWGWLMRGLFLFTGTSGLFCQADWPTVKESSVCLRRLQR